MISRPIWFRTVLAALLVGGVACPDTRDTPPAVKRVTRVPAGGATPGTTPAKSADGPRVTASATMIELGGRNESVVFAKNGKVWGVAWLHKTGRQSRMHIGDRCYEAVYFTLFDDQLKLQLDRPLRVLKRRKCRSERVVIVATPQGFAVSPTDVGARFDLSTKRFERGSAFPPAWAPELKDPPVGAVVAQQSLGGTAVLRSWVVYGVPRATAALELHYDFSPDGRQITRHGVLKIPQSARFLARGHLVQTGATVSLFAVSQERIVRQRFGAGGEPLGTLETLVLETDAPADQTQYPQDGKSIFNVTISTLAGECVILYTRGNMGLKVYSCKTGRKRYLGEATHPSLFCADRCVLSAAGRRIRFLTL